MLRLLVILTTVIIMLFPQYAVSQISLGMQIPLPWKKNSLNCSNNLDVEVGNRRLGLIIGIWPKIADGHLAIQLEPSWVPRNLPLKLNGKEITELRVNYWEFPFLVRYSSNFKTWLNARWSSGIDWNISLGVNPILRNKANLWIESVDRELSLGSVAEKFYWGLLVEPGITLRVNYTSLVLGIRYDYSGEVINSDSASNRFQAVSAPKHRIRVHSIRLNLSLVFLLNIGGLK